MICGRTPTNPPKGTESRPFPLAPDTSDCWILLRALAPEDQGSLGQRKGGNQGPRFLIPIQSPS